MSPKTSQSTTPSLSSTAPVAPKNQSPREQEFSVIVKELKNGTVAGFVRRINVGGRWADNPAEVALKTEVGNALAAMRKNCGSDEQFARLVQEMVDILVNADKETLQIKSEAQKKLSELKEQCAREGSGRGKRSEVPEKTSLFKAAYLKSKEAVFNTIPPELRLPSKEEFERIDALSPTDLSKYETALLGDEKKLKKFLHAWQVGGLDKSWKDYVTAAHPESAKRLDSLYAKAVKQLGSSVVDASFSDRFNRALSLDSKTKEVAQVRADMLKGVNGLEAAFGDGGVGSLMVYGAKGWSYKSAIESTESRIKTLEGEIIKAQGGANTPDSKAMKDLRVTKHVLSLAKQLAIRSMGDMDRYKKNEQGLIQAISKSLQNNEFYSMTVEIEKKKEIISSTSIDGISTGDQEVEKRTLKIGTIGLEEQKRAYRDKDVNSINPSDFAHFLTTLDGAGQLTVKGLSEALSETTARDLILLWWKKVTWAQQTLSNTGRTATLEKTKNLFKDLEQILAKRLETQPNRVRNSLRAIGIAENDIEITLTRLKSAESTSAGLISVLGTTLRGKEKEFIGKLMADASEDAKFEAQKQSNELKLWKFNENTKVNDFVRNLDPLVIAKQIEAPSDRAIIANCEKTFKQLLQDPTEGKKILQILEKIRQGGSINEEQLKEFNGIRSYLKSLTAQYSSAAIGGSPELIVKHEKAGKKLADQIKISKSPLSESEIKASAEKLATNSNLSEQVEQEGAKIAIIESAKTEWVAKKGEKSTQDILMELGLSQYTWEQIMADPALHPIFQIACSKLVIESPQIERMRQILAELTSRHLQKLAAAGTINDYHTNNETRLQVEYGSRYYGQGGGAPVSQEDPRAAFRNIERGSWNADAYWEAGIASTANISYSSLSSQAIPFNSSGNIYSALSTSDTPLNLGNCIVAQDTSGRVTIATPNERFTVEAKEAPAILALTRISGQLNMPFLISSIPLLKPLLKRDDATRDGFSAREESELTARIAAILGFSDLSPTDSSTQIMRHMENQRDPRYSYEWLAQKNGLIGSNGRPIESVLVAAFKNAGSITAATAANAKNQMGEVPNFQTA